MVVRLCAMALAAAALAGCASGGYSGYDSYPDEAYYDGPYDPYYAGPYYGGGFGSYYDDDFDRYYHPSKNVSCDRVRDICYDRYGPSYHATARYLGESEANRAYKKYGDSVFLFSPRPGVSCDRRSKECSDGEWTAPERLKRIEPRNMGSVGSGSGFDDDDAPVRRVAPAPRTDKEAAPTKRTKPRREAVPPPMANNDDDVARPSRRVQSQQPQSQQPQSQQPKAPRRLNSNDKVSDGGAGNACPPRGCRRD
jgi:hypothetical protein